MSSRAQAFAPAWWFALALALALAPVQARAHQPVMNASPRWEDGFGFQVRHEVLTTDEVRTGRARAPNPHARTRRVQTTWLEGVYTFRREVRVTAKVPWVEQRRVVVEDGVAREQRGRGLGDVLLAVPLKRYRNLPGSTLDFGITPQLRLPTGSTRDAYAVGDGSLDAGLSGTFFWESARWYAYFDAFYWRNGKGRSGLHAGDELGLDINLGVHALYDTPTESGLFLLLDVAARNEHLGRDRAGATGGRWLTVGPVLVAYRGNLALRAEWRSLVYENVRGTQLSRGEQWTLSVGVVF